MTYKKLLVRDFRTSNRKTELSFLVDSGAFHSLVPTEILNSLGVEPYKDVEVVLADGTTFTRKVGDAYFELDGLGGTAPVIFGEAGEESLLGATTLESLGLVLNPMKRELYPIKLRHL